ncbi:phosphotransferase [Celeribacter sp. PS-C1]|uniref:phosphotransferase n=1 Tax=Celeribacter sp. PS-C1 TaxID=2820813 RepID=UPI001C682782|nr:phosphotransferase [Celeribacter sp. PS-C1]MBW6416699.1 aminoglycoside phosphotransferase family protein [Celeribacter sp. PS-C1]
MARSFDTLDLVAAHRRLLDFFEERPHLGARASGIEAFQTYHQRAVFRLTWDGRPAIAKLIWHSEKARAVSGQTGALKQIAEALEGRPAHVPEVLHIAPKAGLFVISFVEGPSGLEHLREGRMAEVVDAGRQWLQEATRSNRMQKPFPMARFIRALETCAQGPAQEVADRIRSLLENAPETLTIAAGHGDYWPGNLILSRNGPTAIDLSGHRDIPLIEDITRFASGVCEHNEAGLTEAITAPLLSLLPEVEAMRSFDLFYGLALTQKLHASGGNGYSQERARFLGL